MPIFSVLLLFGLVLSGPATAADEGGVHSGNRLIHPPAEAGLRGGVQSLHARGPGALFTSVEAAAVDALIYAYLQARESRDTERIRGGTIYPDPICSWLESWSHSSCGARWPPPHPRPDRPGLRSAGALGFRAPRGSASSTALDSLQGSARSLVGGVDGQRVSIME